MRIIFLCSGNGGNLKFINEISKISKNQSISIIQVLGVIADRDCGAIEYCKEREMVARLHSFKRTEEEDLKLISILNNLSVDVIVTNVHKIISERVVNAFENKLLNVHYSILPAFAGTIGMDTVENAIKRGCKVLGSSCHLVTSELDGGPILCQSTFPFENQEDVYNDVFRTGALSLLSGVLQQTKSIKGVFTFKNLQVNPLFDIESQVLLEVFNKLYSI